MDLLYIDAEYVVIYIILACCIMGGLKRHKLKAKSFSLLAIDKTSSDVIKAIACVFVLIGHWATYLQKSGVELGIVARASWFTTANIALCWFMYFSGYGLSLKENPNVAIGHDWWKRLIKIYIPLLVVCFFAVSVCTFLPDLGLERYWPGFNKNVHMLHSFEFSYIKPLIMSSFGLFDWYVSCILIFYTIFYLSLYLSKKFSANHTILLGLGMLTYNVIAYYVFGWEQAHYFRFPWIFMLGHLVAVYKKNSNVINMLTVCAFLPTILIHGRIMITCFLLAVVGLLVFAAICHRYQLGGKPLLFLGSISYFFYLSHIRIGYTLLAYTGVKSLLLWIVFTIIISWLMKWFYSIIR